MSAEPTTKRTSRRKTGEAGSNSMEKINGDAGSRYVDSKRLLAVLTAVSRGDFSGRMPEESDGLTGEIYAKVNEIIAKNETLTSELGRISEVVGKEGKIAQRAAMVDASGGWELCIDSVNTLITDLARPTTEVARVIGAVSKASCLKTLTLRSTIGR